MTAHTLGLHETALGYDMAMRLYMDVSKTGYATLNDAANEVLFPNDTARPYKIDVRWECFGQFNRADNTAAFSVGGAELHKVTHLGTTATHVDETFTGAVISGMTKAAEKRFTLESSSTVCAVCINSADIVLYFWQYTCAAQAVGNGVQDASCSNHAPYEGDSVTFSATLKPGAVWHGWYSDAACTQLVSTSQSYTTAAADLTLYAKATREVTGTGSYAKVGSQWAEAQNVYKKINGSWVLQTDDSYKTEMQNGHYKLRS